MRCRRLRYSFMESLRFGTGGASGALSSGFRRGSWLAFLKFTFRGTNVLLQEFAATAPAAVAVGTVAAVVLVMPIAWAVNGALISFIPNRVLIRVPVLSKPRCDIIGV